MARSAILNVMVQAAMKAGRSLSRDFGEVQNLQVSMKGPGDYVSQADRKAEDILFTELSKARPGYAFLMEERGLIEGDDGQHRWIVDPLDGTTNFLHGIPLFAISIALERQGQIVAGVVYNPAMDELYTAERGGGAFMNDRRLRVAGRTKLIGLSAWDVAAGILLIREAGGFISDFAGGQNMLDGGSIVAGNEIIQRALLKTVRKPVTPR
ncbi:MAG: inositol monophosphatase [Mesorhizobium sp.]|nr:MAG: inositol monophosphatase [Mesorhizobium sp.]